MTFRKWNGIILSNITRLKIQYIVAIFKNVLTTANPEGHFSGSSMTFID
jgi:hypothetical protein